MPPICGTHSLIRYTLCSRGGPDEPRLKSYRLTARTTPRCGRGTQNVTTFLGDKPEAVVVAGGGGVIHGTPPYDGTCNTR